MLDDGVMRISKPDKIVLNYYTYEVWYLVSLGGKETYISKERYEEAKKNFMFLDGKKCRLVGYRRRINWKRKKKCY